MFKSVGSYCLLLICIIYSEMVFAQLLPVRVEKFSTEHGLIHPNVSSLYHDSRGQLWVGTTLGLQRFDGFTFKVVSRKGTVTCITEGEDGSVFYGTKKGSVYRVYRENFCYRDSLIDSADVAIVSSLYWNASRNELWITKPRQPLKVVTLQGGQKQERYWGEQVQSVLADRQGDVFIGTAFGLLKTDQTRKKIMTVVPDSLVYDIAIDKKGRLWYLTMTGLSCVDPRTGHHYKTWKPGDDSLFFYEGNNLHTDAEGEVYLTEHAGVWKYDDESGKFMRLDFFYENGERRNYQVYAFCGTADQVKWMGTIYGLVKMDERKNVFRNIYTEKYVQSSMPLQVRSLYETGKDTFLIGTTGQGVYRLITGAGGVSLLPYINSRTHHISNTIFNTINTIHRDKTGTLWFGTNDNTMSFDARNGKLKPIKASYVWHFAEHDTDFWMAAREEGLLRFNNKTWVRKQFKPHTPMKVFHLKKEGDFLLLCTDKGINYFNTTLLRYNTGWPLGDSLRTRITTTAWDIKQIGERYYFTTEGSGLICYDLRAGNFKTWDQYRNMYGMEVDGKGNLWIILDQGMVQFDVAKEQFRFFNSKEGLVSDHFAFYGLRKLHDGTFLCAGERGFTLFDPLKVSPLPSKYEVYISSLIASGNPFGDYIKDGDHLTLNYKQNDLGITFGTSDHHNPAGKVYKYFIEGWDNSWNSSDYHTISYQNIEPGSYKLFVYVEGNENEKAVIRIDVLPPFWQTVWFRLLIVLAVAGIIAYWIYVRIMRERKKYLIENQLLESEIKALRSQMNPHFIFNALGSIQHYIINAEKDKAALYLSRFARLMREVLHYSSLQKITIEEEISLLANYLELESLRFEHKFSWNIHLEEGVETDISIPTLMIQPLVENAVKHGVAHLEKKGSIDVVFSVHERYIRCVITDNGVGRAHYKTLSKNHESKGTSLLQDRLDHINKIYKTHAYIEYPETADGTGTIVEVLIPIV